MKHLDTRFEVKEVTEKGVFSGYGSVYGNLDQASDIMAAGCFTDSLGEFKSTGRMPALLWQHDSRQPIGVYTSVKEDKNGLYIEGALCMETRQGAEAYALLKMGALDGLSVGFMTVEDLYDSKTNVRTITKADLWEVSLVTFPCNEDARVAVVKKIEQIEDLRSAEHYLRDAGALSHRESKALIAQIKAILLRDSAEKTEKERILAAFQARNRAYLPE